MPELADDPDRLARIRALLQTEEGIAALLHPEPLKRPAERPTAPNPTTDEDKP